MTSLSVPEMLRSILIQSRPEAQLEGSGVPPAAPEHVLHFGHYFWLVRRHWLPIALCVMGCTALAAFISFRLTPLYEATAHIAVNLSTPSSVMGNPTIGGVSGTDADQFFNTELQIMKSDVVLRPVAEEFGLLPLHKGRTNPQGVTTVEAPISLEDLSVVHPANSFLFDISYRSPDARKAAEVANAIAHSYILRGMEMRSHSSLEDSAFMEKQIHELKEKMDGSAAALAGYEKQLGVINPDEKTSILTARLLQLNTQYIDAQNDRVRKEVDYRALRSGSPAAIEVSPQAVALNKMQEAVNAAQNKMAAAKSFYGPNYSEYKRAANELGEAQRQYDSMRDEIGKRIEMEFSEANKREAMLHASLLQAKSESDALNASSIQYQELKREAEANKSLYTELFRKVKEAGINGAFQGSAIRIADQARPPLQPIFPNKLALIGLSFLASLALSLITVILADIFDTSLRDPEQARHALGMDVLGILPHVKHFDDLSPIRSDIYNPESALQFSNRRKWFGSQSFYGEAVDTLLNSILVSRRGNPLRSILVTSASPGEGKSSCVAQMAVAHARQGYRTLLIDADLRRPFQQQYFNLGNKAGLAEAILEDLPLSEIRQTLKENNGLDIITAGMDGSPIYNRVGKKVEEILLQVRPDYDLVFIDAPPMLCFAEPIQIASLADGVVVVVQAGETSQQAVMGVLSTLGRIHASILGVVLNRVQHSLSRAYQPYNSYAQRIGRTVLRTG